MTDLELQQQVAIANGIDPIWNIDQFEYKKSGDGLGCIYAPIPNYDSSIDAIAALFREKGWQYEVGYHPKNCWATAYFPHISPDVFNIQAETEAIALCKLFLKIKEMEKTNDPKTNPDYPEQTVESLKAMGLVGLYSNEGAANG